jgi:uncharacterized OB-fold protein
VVAQIWNYGAAPVVTAEVKDPTEGKAITLAADLVIGPNQPEPVNLNAPRSLAFAPDGTFYVADSRNNRIVHFDSHNYRTEAIQVAHEELKNRRLMTTRCKICRKTFFYPRVFCPFCSSQELEWVSLSGKGKLYAFTQQEKALRFMKPDVVGIVELEGCIGKIFTKIEAPFDELTIGMDVEVSFLKLSEDLTLHQFRPVKPLRPLSI